MPFLRTLSPLFSYLPYLAAPAPADPASLFPDPTHRPGYPHRFSTPFYPPSFSSLIPLSSVLGRCDFPMQRYSVRPDVNCRLANRLVDGGGSLPQIEDAPSVPRPAAPSGLGIPLSPRPFTCLTRPFPAASPACKISPDKEAGRASRGGKQCLTNYQLTLCTARFFKSRKHGWTRKTI